MAKELMNEAQRYLLANWQDARMLEESMEAVREQYRQIFDRVAESVKGIHPELDVSKAYVTQFWGSGAIGFSRQEWPDADKGADTPGLWIEYLRLENLSSDAEPAPLATIWVPSKTAKKVSVHGLRPGWRDE